MFRKNLCKDTSFLPKQKLIDAYHCHRCAVDLEFHFAVGECHAVDALGVVLVAWSWVASQCAPQCSQRVGTNSAGKILGNIHFQWLHSLGVGVGETAGGVGVAVGVGQIGLNVDYRGAVHQVGTGNDDSRCVG